MARGNWEIGTKRPAKPFILAGVRKSGWAMSKPTRIVDAKLLDRQLLVRIVGSNVPSGPRKGSSCIVVIVEPALIGSRGSAPRFEIQDDGQAICWPSLQRFVLAEHLIHWYGGFPIYIVPWNMRTLQSIVALRQIAGCWKTPGGYMLLKKNGRAHIKHVWKGLVEDVPGDWSWKNANDQSFRLIPLDSNGKRSKPDVRFKIVRFDGQTLELKQCVVVASSGKEFQMPVVWIKWQRPKSWKRK
jgi:hypothetical protein